jgi:hypothetical protein
VLLVQIRTNFPKELDRNILRFDASSIERNFVCQRWTELEYLLPCDPMPDRENNSVFPDLTTYKATQLILRPRLSDEIGADDNQTIS